MPPTRLFSSVQGRVQTHNTATLNAAALTLPYEVWVHIFSHLELTVLVSRVAKVNSFFYAYVSAYLYRVIFVGEFASPRGLKQLLNLRHRRLGLHVKELTFRPGPVAELLQRKTKRFFLLNRSSNQSALYKQLDQVMSNVSCVTYFNLDYGAYEFQPSSLTSVTPLIQRGWSACSQTLTCLELNIPLLALDQVLTSSTSSESPIRFPNLTELRLLASSHSTDVALVHDAPLPHHPVPQTVLQLLNAHSPTIAILSIGMPIDIDAFFEGLGTMPRLVELRISHFGPGVVDHCYTWRPLTEHTKTFDGIATFLATHARQLNILHLEFRPFRNQKPEENATQIFPFESVLPTKPLAKLHTLSLRFLDDPSLPISRLPLLLAHDTLIHKISASYLPSLHSLHMTPPFLSGIQFQKLLGRIPERITNLELYLMDLNHETFLALCKHAPRLRSLSLHYRNLENPDVVPPNTRNYLALAMMLCRSDDISNWKLEHLVVQHANHSIPHPDFPALLQCIPNLVSLCGRPTSELRAGYVYPSIAWSVALMLRKYFP